MKSEGRARGKILLTILAGIAGIILFGYTLWRVQEHLVMTNIREEMQENVAYIRDTYVSRQFFYPNAQGSLQEIRYEDLKFLKYLSENDPEFEISNKYLGMVNEELDFADILVLDRAGNVVAAASGRRTPLNAQRYDPLRESFKDGMMGVVSRLSDKEAWEAERKQGAEGDTLDPYNMYILYSLAFDAEHEFVISEYGIPLMSLENSMNSWVGVLKNMTIGTHGFAFVWEEGDRELAYYPDETLRFQDVSVLGMDMDRIADGTYCRNTVNGEDVFLYTRYYEELGTWIACAVPEKELHASMISGSVIPALVFALIAADVIFYAILLLRQRKIQSTTGFAGAGFVQPYCSRHRRFGVYSVFMVLIIFFFTFYVDTLFHMSTWADDSKRQLDLVRERLEESENNARAFAEQLELDKYRQMNLLVLFMEKHPEMVGEHFINEAAAVLDIRDLTVFDREGRIRTTCSDERYRYYDTRPIADGLDKLTEGMSAAARTRDIYSWMGNGGFVTLLPVYDAAGGLDGYVYARCFLDQARQVIENCDPARTMDLVSPGENGFVFAVDKENATFSYYPEPDLIGRNVMEYGLRENQIRDNYNDFINIQRRTCYAATGLIGKDLIYYAIGEKDLFRQRLPLSLISAAAALVCLFITGLPLYSSGDDVEVAQPDEEEIAYREKPVSAEYKAFSVLTYYAAGFAAMFTLYSLLHNRGSQSSVLDYVMDGNWEHGLNVFALTASIQTLCAGGIILFLGRRFVNALANILSLRGGTIIRMLWSLAAYIGIFFLAYRCLVFSGMNPTTLMASAGIVSVVIGIGANSLVGDILAGIFLLMEGDIQVGDVVKVGDFRGYVQDMGIRRTRIFDMDTEDVKVFPNKNMQDVINMSENASIVGLKFCISYEEDLERVEKLLTEELKTMYGQVQHLLGEPRYLGLKAMEDSGIILLCTARCHEANRGRVEREINRRVYLMFQKNGIEIPYPQVTVHEAE